MNERLAYPMKFAPIQSDVVHRPEFKAFAEALAPRHDRGRALQAYLLLWLHAARNNPREDGWFDAPSDRDLKEICWWRGPAKPLRFAIKSARICEENGSKWRLLCWEFDAEKCLRQRAKSAGRMSQKRFRDGSTETVTRNSPTDVTRNVTPQEEQVKDKDLRDKDPLGNLKKEKSLSGSCRAVPEGQAELGPNAKGSQGQSGTWRAEPRHAAQSRPPMSVSGQGEFISPTSLSTLSRAGQDTAAAAHQAPAAPRTPQNDPGDPAIEAYWRCSADEADQTLEQVIRRGCNERGLPHTPIDKHRQALRAVCPLRYGEFEAAMEKALQATKPNWLYFAHCVMTVRKERGPTDADLGVRLSDQPNSAEISYLPELH